MKTILKIVLGFAVLTALILGGYLFFVSISYLMKILGFSFLLEIPTNFSILHGLLGLILMGGVLFMEYMLYLIGSFELKYTGDGNSCKIPDDKVREICKIGEVDCCIFCTVGGNGFNCEKFNSYLSRVLLDRHSKGDMRASRIGNCKITGRIE